MLDSLLSLKEDLLSLEAAAYVIWSHNQTKDHPFFGHLLEVEDKAKLRSAISEAKKAYANKVKELKARFRFVK